VEVGKTVADHQGGAARIPAREWIVGFAAEGHCHRLVEQRDALFDPPLAHHGPTDLRQRHALDIGIRELVGYRERSASMPLGCDRIRGPFCVFDREPAELRDRAATLEQAPGAGEPARRRCVLTVDPVLAGEVDRHASRAASITLALKRCVGVAAALDCSITLAEPPE
jgi:hypothetical protein